MDKTPSQTKKCLSCRRQLTASFYGSYRASKDGLNPRCKWCLSNHKRRKYRQHHGTAIPDDLPLIVETVYGQNDLVLSTAINRLPQGSSFRGYQISTKRDLHVHIHINTLGLAEVLVHAADGTCLFKYLKGSYPLVDFKDQVLDLLRSNEIRLEKTDLDLIRVKNELYFI